MKKLILTAAALFCMALLFGCSSAADDHFDVVIGEDQFARTVDNILENFDSYVGKTVRVEGVFEYFGVETVYRSVLRRLGTC